MTGLNQFSDDLIKGKWARIVMADGNPCYVAIGPRSIVIKKSKSGIIGPRLYEVRDLESIERMVDTLIEKFPEDLTPLGMTNCILRPVVNAVLHVNNLEQVVGLFKSIETMHNPLSARLSPS